MSFSDDVLLVHGTKNSLPGCRPISFPIYQTATFINPGLGKECPYSYSRIANPTRGELEQTIAALERGTYGFAFSSGLSAILAVFSLLDSGDHVVMCEDVYGGTYRMMNVLLHKFGVRCTAVDTTDPVCFEAAFTPKTKLVFLETPTNPLGKVTDISLSADLAHKHGALLCVDNTFLTPWFQKPLLHGADIVVHSATKYLGGHNDTMAGLCVVNDDTLADKLKYILGTEGTALSPFDSWLILRGMKTLALRMQRHEQNAMRVAAWLRQNRNVEAVYYPGLEDAQGYDVMKRQTTGFGGVLSFRLKFASLAESVLCGGRVIHFAESLGGVETLITYPLTQTHATTPPLLREKLGIDEKLIRLSCGIEQASDILFDLERTLGENRP